MAAFDHPYLDLARMELLRRVKLVPRGLAEGTFSGPHASRYRGSAVEFADFRDYTPGDDIRLVDWRVYGRSDRYYIRLYEAERNLLCYQVLDTSGSMGFAGEVLRTPTKLEHACRLSAAIAWLVVREGDEIGLSLATDRVHEHLPARGGHVHLASLLNRLAASQAAGSTDLGQALRQAFARLTRRGVVCVISDFLTADAGLWSAIDLLRQARFEVLLFQIVHPEELELPDLPLARFTDPEGRPLSITVEPALLRENYRKRFAQHLATIRAGARSRGCDWFLARTDADPYLFLKQCFLERDALAG